MRVVKEKNIKFHSCLGIFSLPHIPQLKVSNSKNFQTIELLKVREREKKLLMKL